MTKKNKKQLPEHQQKNIVGKHSIIKQSAYTFSGPIPPPEILSKYDKISPGLAEKIIIMAEKQSTHRQSLESKVIYSDIKIRSRGQIFAFILGILAACFSTLLLLNGKSISGFITLFGTLGTLITAFMYGSHKKSKERKEKHIAQYK